MGVGDQVFYESDVENLLREWWMRMMEGGGVAFWISGGLCDGVVAEVMVGSLD